ncbi:peptide ABC transporter substrate-binding protein [Siminovitchia terrae]|uniref:ABC transporter substrate-binding protein n=1 Tax=Siminovitchia terrae TaxID=1914933 RepID=UPI001B077326|nr:ABC transporter substrate-binding protein [Siminovitchia terrae]GIN89332.1 peptide ABC transporter substrate-binding protein [Siminovitchia terrae]
MKKTWKVLFLLAAAFSLVMAGCGNSSSDKDKKKKETASEMRVALTGQPPTIDPMMTPGASTKQVARHIFEQLLTLNSNFEPVPMLADSVDKSDDGKTYTFNLRKGVKFHNGEEMTADDVVASMNRWIEQSSVAKATFGDSQFEKVDDYTVELKLNEPTLDTMEVIASPKQFSAIMPKEVIEKAGKDGAKEYIGTGPFKFSEWSQDQFIHLTKFEDYSSLDTEADGLSGKKEALVDDLYFDIVTDPATRLAGLQTGQYDVSLSVSNDNYEQVLGDESLNTYKDLYGNITLVYNKEKGPFTDFKLREAVNTAINSEEVMLAVFGHSDLYEIDAGYMNKAQTNWYNDSGKDVYNQGDTAKAKEMLKQAGYNGEEVRLMVTRDYDYQYNAAVVLQDQLKAIGINVKLEVYDWGTLLDRENDPNNWDLLVIGFSTVTTPSQVLYLTNNQHGFTNDKKIAELLDSIKTSNDQEKAKALFKELQDYGWHKYLPVSNIGFHYDFITTLDKVDGFTVFDGPVLWNTSVSK